VKARVAKAAITAAARASTPSRPRPVQPLSARAPVPLCTAEGPPAPVGAAQRWAVATTEPAAVRSSTFLISLRRLAQAAVSFTFPDGVAIHVATW
jgi:hypothetical protein